MKQIFRLGAFFLVLLFSTPYLFSQTLQDTDMDTRVETERTGDEDIIWFSTEGVDRARFIENRFEFLNTGGSIFMGEGAGLFDDLTANENIFIGDNSGRSNTSGRNNVGLGRNTLQSNSTGIFNIAIGGSALSSNSGSYNVGIGGSALNKTTTGQRNIGIGYNAMRFTTTGLQNSAIGSSALQNLTTGGQNIGIGYRAGFNLGTGSGNILLGVEAGFNYVGDGSVFIGDGAGYNESNSNRLVIENSTATNPLIYGEFDNDVVTVNGNLTLRDGFTDDDKDTKIQVEESNDDDVIRFDVDGAEVVAISKTRMHLEYLGDNTFIGFNAGVDNVNTDSTGKWNTSVGFRAGQANIDGRDNTFLGYDAAFSNTMGKENTFIGTQTGVFNIDGSENTYLGTRAGYTSTGSGNVAIGHEAGYANSDDNRLYIANTLTNTPLIYGEFDNKLLTVHGEMTIEAESNSSALHVMDSTTLNGQAVIYAENTDTGGADRRAVRGTSTPQDGWGYGGQFTGSYRGVYGYGDGGDYTGGVIGVYGIANGGSVGNRYGVYGTASGGAEAWGGYFPAKVYANTLRIGSTAEAAGYELSVDGKAICEELKIQNSGSWPDYVFATEYDLKPLEEVEAFIQENKHLPNIPSAAQITDSDGFHIGEMQNKTIEKVEELTLYAIDANKRIKDLEGTNAELAKQNAELKAMMLSILKKLEK